jgi:hypothetical protein
MRKSEAGCPHISGDMNSASVRFGAFNSSRFLQELIPQDRLTNLCGLDSGQKKKPISL